MQIIIDMKQSEGELVFTAHLQHEGIEFEQEYKFHPKRKWRADFALKNYKILVEIEGGVYTNGRHTRGSGFVKDCEKYNNAVMLGWKVLRFPTHEVMDNTAIEFLVEYIKRL